MIMENPTKETKGHDAKEGIILAIAKTSLAPLPRNELGNHQNHHASSSRKDFGHCQNLLGS